MVLALDNILDKNFYPTEEARKNTMDLRPMGIGLMGFAEALVDLKISYDSEEAVIKARKIGNFMREVCYAQSEELAKESGAFAHYDEAARNRSEEHTTELQTRGHLVCRLLLEKRKQKN